MSLPARRTIVGTAVSIADYDEVLDAFDSAITKRAPIYVCCAPASTLVYARRNSALAAALREADIVTPDGMGVVYTARLLGEKLPGRVYGPDLMLMQLERAERTGQSIWLYGGHDGGALRDLRTQLAERFPALMIAGSWSPPHRPLNATETDDLVARINHDAPDVIWVGLGTPKQDLWMHTMRERLNAPVICGVGAAFDFHAGRVAQAPAWMQRVGLEWLYRLTRDPHRMLRRYAATLPHFVVLSVWQALRERVQR